MAREIISLSFSSLTLSLSLICSPINRQLLLMSFVGWDEIRGFSHSTFPPRPAPHISHFATLQLPQALGYFVLLTKRKHNLAHFEPVWKPNTTRKLLRNDFRLFYLAANQNVARFAINFSDGGEDCDFNSSLLKVMSSRYDTLT